MGAVQIMFADEELHRHTAANLAGLSKHVDLKLVSRLEFRPVAVAMRNESRP